MALMTAARAGVVPPSPPERTPSRFDGDGTSLNAVFSAGNVSARGIALSIKLAAPATARSRDRNGCARARLADTLGDAAMGLAVHDHRVDRTPHIVDRAAADDLNGTGLGIDFDLADLRAVRKAGDRQGLVRHR